MGGGCGGRADICQRLNCTAVTPRCFLLSRLTDAPTYLTIIQPPMGSVLSPRPGYTLSSSAMSSVACNLIHKCAYAWHAIKRNREFPSRTSQISLNSSGAIRTSPVPHVNPLESIRLHLGQHFESPGAPETNTKPNDMPKSLAIPPNIAAWQLAPNTFTPRMSHPHFLLLKPF